MNSKKIVPAALVAAALAGGAAEAQGFVPSRGSALGVNSSFTLTQPQAFRNGAGQLVVPPTANGFNNGFNTGFNTGFNNGFNNGSVNNGFNTGFNGGFNNGFAAPTGTGFVGNGGVFTNQFGGPVAPGLNPGFGAGSDPRFVDPRGAFFDPRLQVNGSNLGYTPGVTPQNQFVPGNGGGYFYDPYVGGYSGPVTNTTGAYAQQNTMGRMNGGGGLRIVGVNSPPLQAGPYRRIRIRNSGSGSGYDYQSRARADALARTGNPAAVDTQIARGQNGSDTEEIQGVVNTGSIDPQQVRLASRMEDVMENRPLIEGMVMRKEANGIMVRVEQNGQLKVERYPLGQVFFFQNGGKLQTGSTRLAALQPGDRVLVPQPISVRPLDQRVAGSRQEMGGSRSSVRSAVRGTRSSTRNRRPAK